MLLDLLPEALNELLLLTGEPSCEQTHSLASSGCEREGIARYDLLWI